MRGIIRWAKVLVQLYVLFLFVFYASNIAAIIAIRGFGPLTWGVMGAIFVRDAIVCIPITAVGTLIYALWMPAVRRSIERHRR